MAEDNQKSLDNQKEFEKSVKETSKETRTIKDSMDELAKSMLSAALTMADIVRNTQEAKKETRDFKSEFDEAAKLQKAIAGDSKTVAELGRKVGKGQKLTNAETRKFEKAQSNIARMKDLQADLEAKLVNATEEEAELINKIKKDFEGTNDVVGEVEQGIKKIEDSLEEIDKKTNFFDAFSDVASAVPGLSKAFGEFGKASKAAGEAAAKGGNAFKAGAKELGGAVAKLTLAFVAKTAVKGMSDTNQKVTDLARNLNITREAARGLEGRFRSLSADTKGLTSKQFMEAQNAMTENLGISADLSDDTLVTMGAMTKKFGLSAKESAELTKFTAATGQNLKTFNNELIGSVKMQNVSNGLAIRYQDVMQDISEAGSAVRLSVSKFPGGIAKAAYQARKLGLSFSTMESIAGNLLDFESSLAAEMEAELFLGRDLNLDKARRAALDNDLVGMANALAENGITQAKFTNMTRLEQESVAKAMGMTRDQMAESFELQSSMTNLSFDESKSLSQNIKDRMAKIEALKEEGKLEEAAKLEKELANELGEDETYRQLKNSSLAEKQQEAMEKMAEAAGSLAIVLEPITWLFGKIAYAAGETMGFLTKMGLKIKTLFKSVKPVFNLFKGISDKISTAVKGIGSMFGLFKGGIKTVGKGGIKAVLKKIPILGALVGAGLAYQRFKKGDILGGAAEVLSGIASIFPGIGTGISLALDGALLAGDMSGVTGGDRRKNGKNFSSRGIGAENRGVVDAEDFVIKPLGKDTITMAGGTKLGGNVEELLQELISLVKTGGNVYLDGTKVGSTLVLNSKLSN